MSGHALATLALGPVAACLGYWLGLRTQRRLVRRLQAARAEVIEHAFRSGVSAGEYGERALILAWLRSRECPAIILEAIEQAEHDVRRLKS